MAERDLKLNSISRYSKDSPQFILEEHGHCEVPAGCGGVVLRWRNPHKVMPIQIWIHTTGTSAFYLDGTLPASGRPLVDYSEHVFAFRISDFDSSYAFLMFAAMYDEREMIHNELSRSSDTRVSILSVPDGSWKYSLIEPLDDSWMYSGFDDSIWLPLIILKPLQKLKEDNPSSYRIRRLVEFGAQGLGINDTGANIWVRRVFSLSKEPQTRRY